MTRPTLRAAVGAGFVLLLVNTGYIWAFASPTIFYMTNVLAHLVGGLALAVAFAILLKREPELRRPLIVPAALFAIAIAFALYLVAVGNLREHRWVLYAHIVSAGLGVAAVLPFAYRLARRAGGPRALGVSVGNAAAFAAVLPLAFSIYVKANPNPHDRIVNTPAPLSMEGEGGGPTSPFFPSSAKTNVGGIIPSNFFMDSATCGECHKDIFEQWNSSAHHFASLNNQFYRKSIEYMQDVIGSQPSKWCAGCHDHAVFFNGRFERPIKEQIDTPEAHAGLACTSCHAITRVNSSMGQGDFTIEYPALHELATSKNPIIKTMDRFLTYLNPEPHRRTFMKPFMKLDSAEYCSSCHKVHLDVPVNSYRWFRGFNDYDNWQASGISGQGARSFYYPPKSLTCVDCHMPPTKSEDPGRHADGTVHNHRFPAANTALPFVNRDDAQMKITKEFLQSGFIRVDIFAVSPIDEKSEGTRMIRRAQEGPQLMTGFAVGEEAEQHGPIVLRDVGQVAAPIDKAQPVLAPGSTVRLDVVVRTVRIGHFFPGGTVDAFDVWLELEGRDADGRIVYWSGQVEDEGRGPVEPGAHFYRALQLDGKGNPIDKRNAWQTRSVQYVRLIPPGAADTVHYRVRIPEDARGPITFTAKLNYRKFAHSYTQFAYAGQPKPGQDPSLVSKEHNSLEYSFDPKNVPKNVSGKIKGEIPNLPIIVLAEATAQIPVGDGKTPTKWTPVVTKKDRERWNDWGIGMLLQGDIKGAEYAFKTVTEAEPGYADGWLNVARALIQEGETDKAKPYIQKALAIDSSLGRIHFFKAMIEKADGDYPAAIASLRRVLEQYPRDRVALNQLARLHFLQREYTSALEVLERVAKVDPEDLQMHYTAMLTYRGLGNLEAAARSEKLFRRFKAEESAQAITGDRRRAKPEENNERQAIHEHESVPLPVFGRAKTVLTTRSPKASGSRVGGKN
ncbi:MAG TPA: tetratricopeptide repeat protein [Vicinamibacterales bacterium]|nr:tetratricopeptide repeat protein [Vicinamibacterales bacterium]